MHYVIGDVHGCYDEMQTLINKIEDKDEDAVIIFVGDFIDRGPKSWEVVQWCMENITPEGKYQAVLGNHEDLFIRWFYVERDDEEIEVLKDAEDCYYGFNQVALDHGIERMDEIEKIVNFFEELPLYIKFNIQVKSGKMQEYIIAHAFAPDNPSEDDKDDDLRRETYLWSKKHFWSYGKSIYEDENEEYREILVHGHSATVNHEYRLRDAWHNNGNPGFINYRRGCINVDGGCVYLEEFSGRVPCNLCAICLETLEELYAFDWEERMRSVPVTRKVPERYNMTQSEYEEYIRECNIQEYRETYIDRKSSISKGPSERQILLKRLGMDEEG